MFKKIVYFAFIVFILMFVVINDSKPANLINYFKQFDVIDFGYYNAKNDKNKSNNIMSNLFVSKFKESSNIGEYVILNCMSNDSFLKDINITIINDYFICKTHIVEGYLNNDNKNKVQIAINDNVIKIGSPFIFDSF